MKEDNIRQHRFKRGNAADLQRDRAIQSAGGKARAAKIRERKQMKELLALALEEVVTNPEGEKASKKEVAAIQIANAMARGNLRATELGLKILGEFEERYNVETKDTSEQRFRARDIPDDILFALADRLQNAEHERLKKGVEIDGTEAE